MLGVKLQARLAVKLSAIVKFATQVKFRLWRSEERMPRYLVTIMRRAGETSFAQSKWIWPKHLAYPITNSSGTLPSIMKDIILIYIWLYMQRIATEVT